jgi:acyl-CoA synthetase (AMP-forming)/AMP-acid ligase II
MGPGRPFETVELDVLGCRHEVFAQRLPHLRALLQQGAEELNDRPYLVDAERTATFAQAAGMVADAAAWLADEHGIEKGDRVALAAANRIDHVIVAWAVIVLGGVIVALNGWWTGAELEYGIDLTRPKLLIGDSARLARLDGRCPGLPRRYLAEAAGEWSAGGQELPVGDLEEDDPFVVLFTSGTTGRPKGAVLSHRNQLHWMQSIALRQAATGATPRAACEIAALPLFHVSGLNSQAIASVGNATKLVYTRPGRWDPEEHLRVTEEHRVTTWRLVPTQAWRLLDCPSVDHYDLSSLRSIVGGGSIWSPNLLERMATKWPQARSGLVVGFGMTESGGTGASAVMPGLMQHPGSVGLPPPAARLRVCRPGTDAPLDDGRTGEIQIRSASVFLGYFDDRAATEAALTPDRWYRTGDFGRVESGLLYLDGRRSDLILRGGENIYPAEIEDRLQSHPEIDDAVVLGVAHDELGQEVKAVIVVRPGAHLDAAAVQAWAGATLAPFKVPAQVEFRDALPRNATGKVLKHLLDPGAVTAFAGEE